jgi:hypothetical protein
MANPAHPALDLDDGIITFSNEGVTIAVETNFPQEPLTVESATLTTPHDNTVDLGITNFEVPPPVVEHVLDQVTPSVASATLSQEGEMVDRAVTDPENFLHVFEGGGAAFREPVVQGSVEGLLGGPDTHIAIDLALNPPGDPGVGFIERTVDQSHLELNFKWDLEIKHESEVLSYSWPLDEALSTPTGLTDHPDWWTV